MITGDLKSKVDKLWTTFWNNGISNPLSVIEQISYLLFIKRLDDLELVKEKKAQRLGGVVLNPTFGPNQQTIRWSQFKNLDDGEALLAVVRDGAFPFIKDMGKPVAEVEGQAVKEGKPAEGSTYAKHMRDAVFLIGSPALLVTVVEQIGQIPMDDRDAKGDLYEYMLSKLSTAGTNGQYEFDVAWN